MKMRFSVGQEHDGLEFVRILRPSKRSVAYVVRDVVSERLEYLKVVPEHLQQNEESIQRFMREAKLHAGLSHVNIAQFYSVRRLDGELVMTREWVEGETIESKIAASALPVPQAVDYIGQALLALQHAHGQGVIHRDITPACLLITESGVLKLMGFDLARSVADPRLTGTGVVMGSVHYMAPEHVKGLARAEERSDLYALGAVLFEAVTGRRPFERKSDFDVMLAQVDDPPPSPRELNEMISPGLEQVIYRALEKDPEKRFQNAAEFREALLSEADSEVRRSLHPAEPVEISVEAAALPPPAGPPAAEPVTAPAEVLGACGNDDWTPPSSDISRLAGFAIAAFSVGLLFFLGGMILLGG